MRNSRIVEISSKKTCVNLILDRTNTNCTYIITHPCIGKVSVIIYLVLYNLCFSGSTYTLERTSNCYDSANLMNDVVKCRRNGKPMI